MTYTNLGKTIYEHSINYVWKRNWRSEGLKILWQKKKLLSMSHCFPESYVVDALESDCVREKRVTSFSLNVWLFIRTPSCACFYALDVSVKHDCSIKPTDCFSMTNRAIRRGGVVSVGDMELCFEDVNICFLLNQFPFRSQVPVSFKNLKIAFDYILTVYSQMLFLDF